MTMTLPIPIRNHNIYLKTLWISKVFHLYPLKPLFAKTYPTHLKNKVNILSRDQLHTLY